MTSLSSLMSQLDLLESEGRHLELSAYILNIIIKNVDASPLAGKIIKYLALPSPPLKKVMYSFLTRYSSKISDLNILATNSLLKDFQDPNPYMRRLVIKTAASIECLSDLSHQLLPQALDDTSPYVRSTAATSSTLIINKSNIDANQDIVNKLYEMIRDPDPSVICSCLAALDEILKFDGGVVVNSKMISYLFSRISEFQEWNFTILHMVLKKYAPKNTDELLYFLNALDRKLQDSNPAVFSLAADIALHYINHMKKNFCADILQQIFPQLKLLLISSSCELLFALLEIIESYLPAYKSVFTPCYDLFLCRFCDSVVVKVKKLKILVHFVDSANASELADELLSYCSDNNKEISCQAICSYIAVIKEYPHVNSKDFVSLINISHNNLNEEILNSLTDLDFNKLTGMKEYALEAISNQAKRSNNIKGKLSLLKLIGNYGKEMHSSPYIIEQFMNDEQDSENEIFLSHLLTAAVKLFLVRPEEMYLILGHIFQWAKESPSLLLRKQASVYYFLLKDQKIAEKVLLNCKPVHCINETINV